MREGARKAWSDGSPRRRMRRVTECRAGGVGHRRAMTCMEGSRTRNRPGRCRDAGFRCRRPMVGATGVRTGGCHIPCGGGFAGRRGRRPLWRETGAGAESPGAVRGRLVSLPPTNGRRYGSAGGRLQHPLWGRLCGPSRTPAPAAGDGGGCGFARSECGDVGFRCRRPMVGATGVRTGFVIGTEATTPPSAAWREKAADTVPCTGEV